MNQQPNLFTFDPNSSDAPLARGRHEVEIVAAEARTSRAGNPMLDLTYRTFTRTGDVFVKDYLVSTPRSRWKIKRFCAALGLDFEAGRIDPQELVGKRLTVDVGIEEDGNGRDRNVVTEYVLEGHGTSAANGTAERLRRTMSDPSPPAASGAKQAPAAEDEGDEIPF